MNGRGWLVGKIRMDNPVEFKFYLLGYEASLATFDPVQ
jgi:hypothetical protein